MLVCVVLVGAAAAAPHIVKINARQKNRKLNLLLYLDVIILLFSPLLHNIILKFKKYLDLHSMSPHINYK